MSELHPYHEHPLKRIPGYPASFHAYRCDVCNKTYEWWQLAQEKGEKPFYKDKRRGYGRENFIRAKIFEAYPNKEIKPEELYREMRKHYSHVYYPKEEALPISKEDVSSDVNRIYNRLNKRKKMMMRCPTDKERIPDEKFECIQFNPSVPFIDLFNKRVIRQWDFENVSNLSSLKEKVELTPNIKYKERWLAAIDFFKKSNNFKK